MAAFAPFPTFAPMVSNGSLGWRADFPGWLSDDVVAQKKRTLMIAVF
jgi:hypothetical protein